MGTDSCRDVDQVSVLDLLKEQNKGVKKDIFSQMFPLVYFDA